MMAFETILEPNLEGINETTRILRACQKNMQRIHTNVEQASARFGVNSPAWLPQREATPTRPESSFHA